MNIDLTPIFQAIIALIAALVCYKLIPWIKARTTEAQQDNYKALVKTLVFAAEQIYGAGKGKEKLNYVKLRLAEKGFDVDVDAIEAAVRAYFNNNDDVFKIFNEDNDIPPLEDWPLGTLVDFCEDNGIPCEDCVEREDYIKAILKGAKQEPPDED